MIDAGRLTRRVTLQARTLGAANEIGEKPETWSDLATVWAEKRDVTGREIVSAGAEYSEASTRFLIRYRADLTPIHRVVDQAGVTHNVLHVAEIGRKEGLELLCRTVA